MPGNRPAAAHHANIVGPFVRDQNGWRIFGQPQDLALRFGLLNDICVALQYLLAIPIALALYQILQAYNPLLIRAATIPVFPELTERERELLDLIARGETNADIAQRLVLSPHTVRNHISNIFFKLQVADRAEAIIRARNAGLG